MYASGKQRALSKVSWLIWLACLFMSLQARAETAAEKLFEYGVGQIKVRQYSEAVITLKKGLMLAPNDPLGHFFLGEALWALNERDQAILEYRKALDIDGSTVVSNEARTRISHYETGRAAGVVAGKTYVAILSEVRPATRNCTQTVRRTITLVFQSGGNKLEWNRSIERAVHNDLGSRSDFDGNEVDFPDTLRRDQDYCQQQAWSPSQLNVVYSVPTIWNADMKITIISSLGTGSDSNVNDNLPGTVRSAHMELLDGGKIVKITVTIEGGRSFTFIMRLQ